MRALLVGDVHLSDRPPSVRTDTYAEDILDKLRFCVADANRLKVEALVLLGDVFHIKTPSRTSHRLVQATAQVLEGFQHPFSSSEVGRMLIVPGNHDTSQDRIESLPQPAARRARPSAPASSLLSGYDGHRH